MITLWLSLVVTYVGLATVLGRPLVIALPLAVFIATLTVALASLVRLVFSCSLERSLVAAVAWICVLYISLSLLGGLSSKFNQRIGETVTWINGMPTAAGLWRIACAVLAIACATFAAYVLTKAAGRAFRWLMGASATE